MLRESKRVLPLFDESNCSSIFSNKAEVKDLFDIEQPNSGIAKEFSRYIDAKHFSDKRLINLKSHKKVAPSISVMNDSFYGEIYDKYLKDNILTKKNASKSRQLFSSKRLLPVISKVSKKSVGGRSVFKSETTDDIDADKYSNKYLTTIINTNDKREDRDDKKVGSIIESISDNKVKNMMDHKKKRNDIFKNTITTVPDNLRLTKNENSTVYFDIEKPNKLSPNNMLTKNLFRNNNQNFHREMPWILPKNEKTIVASRHKSKSRNRTIKTTVEAEFLNDSLQTRTVLPTINFEKIRQTINLNGNTQEASFVPKQKKKFFCCF